jgi:BolA protein
VTQADVKDLHLSAREPRFLGSREIVNGKKCLMEQRIEPIQPVVSVESLTALLKHALDAQHVQVIDNSAQHLGHSGYIPGMVTHAHITVVADRFEGMPILERYRQIQDALKPAHENGLHATEIKAYTPSTFPPQT